MSRRAWVIEQQQSDETWIIVDHTTGKVSLEASLAGYKAATSGGKFRTRTATDKELKSILAFEDLIVARRKDPTLPQPISPWNSH